MNKFTGIVVQKFVNGVLVETRPVPAGSKEIAHLLYNYIAQQALPALAMSMDQKLPLVLCAVASWKAWVISHVLRVGRRG